MNRSYRISLVFCLSILSVCANSSFSFAEQLQPLESQSIERILPNIWLETAANKMLSQIDQQRDELERDEIALQKFLYDNAIPFWDTRIMAKGLGGTPYRHASDELKAELEEQWKLTLVRYFLKAIPYYDKQRLVLEDKMDCPSTNRCWLRTRIEIVGRKSVELDFYVRWNKRSAKKQKWQVIDLRVAGVSLLKHKRGETRELLKKEGLKGLISVLKQKNEKVLLTSIEPSV